MMTIDRSYEDDITFFIAFCIEIYKNAHKLSGEETSLIFSDHDIMSYLAENYDILHTQSPSWILAEIETTIKESSK